MKRINNLTTRLLMVTMPVILGVLVLFSIRCGDLYRSLINDEVSKQLQLRVDNAAQQITGTLSEVNRMGAYLHSNQKMNIGLFKAHQRPDQFDTADRISLYKDVINPMLELTNNSNHYYYTLFPFGENVFCDYITIFPMKEFPPEIPLADILSDSYGRAFYHMISSKRMEGSEEKARLLCITRVIASGNGTPLGALNANVYVQLLESPVKSLLSEEGEYWYRCELSDGEIVFENGEKNDGMVFLTSSISGGRATLHYGVHASVIDRQTARQNQTLIQFSAILIPCAALLIALLSNLVMHRTRRVIRKFSELKPGAALTMEPLSGRDEAAQLDQTFTRLYRAYYESVNAQQKMVENQRLLETNLLLSRMNPHFLYNTLSALRWKMPKEQWEIVDQMVAFYRGMLAKGRQIGLLSSEAELMRQYIALQRFTYSRSIDYQEHLAPDTLNLLIPKFLLQPVLENAIQHSAGENTLHLSLSAQIEGEKLLLTVTNDGVPIDSQVMERLNAMNVSSAEDPLLQADFNRSDAGGYGIFNIIVRLQILFGPGYGLWHEQLEGGGTRARYILPICSNIEEMEGWKKDHKLEKRTE